MQQRRTEPKGGNEGKSTQYQEQRTDGYPRKRGALPLGDVTINGEQQPRDPYCRVRMRPKQPCGNEPAHHVTDARRSEEHTSELQSLMRISYAVFCLKKKN